MFVVGYMGDMAYGNKAERINRMMDDILEKEKDSHWFTPLLVDESDVPKLKNM